jgi:hypothetical protein
MAHSSAPALILLLLLLNLSTTTHFHAPLWYILPHNKNGWLAVTNIKENAS